MAVPISLGQSGPRTARRHAVDMVLQSRAPKYGSGWIYPKTAVGHGRVAFLLLAIAKNGGITNTACAKNREEHYSDLCSKTNAPPLSTAAFAETSDSVTTNAPPALEVNVLNTCGA